MEGFGGLDRSPRLVVRLVGCGVGVVVLELELGVLLLLIYAIRGRDVWACQELIVGATVWSRRAMAYCRGLEIRRI